MKNTKGENPKTTGKKYELRIIVLNVFKLNQA